MKKTNILLSVLLLVSAGLHAQTFHSLTPLAGFGPNGNGEMLSDGSIPFLTSGTIQRGLTHNPVTGNLIFVDRGVAGQSTNVAGAVYVLNGTNGSVISTFNTEGIQGGSFAQYAVGVSDDGVVFIANVIADTNAGPFKIYRWTSETSTDAPVLAFSGVMGTNNLRWGNTIDVRGSGAGTQILVSAGGAESAVLTTVDGANFTATILKTDFTASLQGALSFGEGNTYWAKFSGQPLRLLSFDLGAGTATTIRTFGVGNIPEIVPCEIAAVDVTNKLLATVNYNGANPDRVSIYDISNLDDVPQLLDTLTVTSINSGSSGSPRGYLTFGGGNLYMHNINNGIYAFDLIDGAIPAPVILTQPSSVQSLQGNTVSFRVIAQRGLGFQWKKGVSDLVGKTNSILTLTNIQISDAGNYTVVVSNATSSVTSSNATLTVLAIEDFYRLTPLWSTTTNAQPYFTITGGSGNTPNQRTMAYNASSNHLYVVSRGGSATANFNVYVINADTGAQLYTLNTNGSNFTGWAGQIGLVGIDVADDGSIYACNVDLAGAWKLYRWADGNSNTVPEMVFNGDPFGSPTTIRWGDTMDVRGGGIDTQILIDAQPNGSPFFAVFRPTDASLTAFTPVVFSGPASANSVGRSLQFGVGDTIWQKRFSSTILSHSSFDLEAPFSAAPLIGVHTNLASTMTFVALDESRNLLGAINNLGAAGVSPYKAELYDISDIDSPVLLSQYNFPQNKLANADIGEVVFGGDKMFALNAQNGIVAFKIEIGAIPPLLNIARSGGDVVLSWQGSGFVLEAKTNLTSLTWDPVSYQTGPTNTATNTVSGEAKFYRLRK